MSKLVVLERTKLYEEVWAEPVRTVAKRYGISDTTLRKHCKDLNVPLPPRGYWVKIAAGKHPRRAALTKLKKGESDRKVYRSYPVYRRPQPEGLEAAVPVPVDGEIVVPDVLEEPHRLVARTARRLSAKRHKDLSGCLNIDVSEGSRDRALRIMDALLKAMDRAGLKVEATTIEAKVEWPSYGWQRQEPPPPRQVTRVCCDEEWIEFSLSERMKRVEDPKPDPPKNASSYYYQRTTYSHLPTGELSLRLENIDYLGIRRVWSDATRQRVEGCLTTFVANLSKVALAIRLDREERAREAAAAAEAALCREQEEHRRYLDQKRLDQLRRDVEQRRAAEGIRAYIAAADRLLRCHDNASPEAIKLRWQIKWAAAYANRIDPLAAVSQRLKQCEEAEE